MEARAIVRNVRMTPRKIKLICDLIRGKDAGEAMAIIMNTPKAACEPMEKEQVTGDGADLPETSKSVAEANA